MYMDAVVIAGIVTVLLMIGFFVGVGVFIVKDQKHHGAKGCRQASSWKPWRIAPSGAIKAWGKIGVP